MVITRATCSCALYMIVGAKVQAQSSQVAQMYKEAQAEKDQAQSLREVGACSLCLLLSVSLSVSLSVWGWGYLGVCFVWLSFGPGSY